MDTSYDKSKWLKIDECLKISGYGNSHFRTHILPSGKIKYEKSNIPGTSIPRILVDKQSFLEYLKANNRVPLESGQTRVTLVMSQDDMLALEKFMAERALASKKQAK